METRTYINELIPREIRDNARVLGVIARGTDYRNEANEMIGRSVRIPDIEDVINRCKELMITWKCDYVFIASEDAEFFDKLKEAFGSKAIYIEQKRVQHDYTQSYRSIAELLEIQNEKEYGRRYLAIIQALANCTVLLTNRTSGACSAALGLNNHNYEHYELVRCRV